MKVLETHQQVELQELLAGLDSLYLDLSISPEQKAQIKYWTNELKPKRVRRRIRVIEEST